MPATKQKTWTELLGPWDDDCCVSGARIVRYMNNGQWRILWTFDRDEDMAHRCFVAWKSGH